MKNLLFSGLSSLLLPMGAYAGPPAGASYQRTYLSSSINASTADLSHTSALPRDLVDLSGDQLDIQVAHAVRELVIVDEGVAEADKAVLRRALKPGVEMVHISSASAGLPQLIAALDGHKNLAAIHVISHAEAGAILLGNSRITAENIQREVHAFAALSGAVRNGGDLLFYGCDLAANKAGEDLLDIISNNTGLDVAASNNLTGNPALKGDWDLEVKRGNIESALAFSEKSLKDFSSVLVASSGTKTFSSGWTDNNSNLTSTDFIVTAKDTGGTAISNISIYSVAPNPAYIQTGYNGTTTGTYFYVAADGTNTGSFELTGLVAGEANGLGGQFTNVQIVGIKPDNSTITSSTITGSGTPDETFTFAAGQLTNFSGVQLKAFKLEFDTTSGSGTKPFFEFRSFTITGALAPSPTITSATYNTTTGALVVTGTNFTATGGATNDVDASDFTLTGEGGSTYTLTDTADVEISSATSFTLTLSATDRAAANLIINKTGTSSTGATTYNLAGAAGFIVASGATADLTGNGITATVAAPTVTSATYDASTGALVVTGTNLKKLNGADNEIIANKFTLRGEGGTTYTLTDTANVEISSGTSFTLSLSATDKAGANLILNKNGTLSTDISTYNIAAAEDWNAGADAAVTIADTTGNGVTVSNVAVPTITSSTYDVSTGALVVTGTGLLKSQGATNDIVANKFTFTGQGAATYALTDTANVEVTSGTSFTLTLSATDRNAVGALLNKNGTSANDATTYNLAAAEDWNAGADSAVVIADLTGNGITTSNAFTAPNAPTIGTATAGDGQADVTFTAPGSNGGSAITSYTATANPGGATGNCAGPAACTITVTGLTNGTAYTFTVTATNAIGTSTASGATGSVTPKADQTITFANPGSQSFGTTPTLSATSTSGLTVTFSSSTTGVCTVSGTTLTFVTAGSCTIDADQAGNGSTNAAPTVSRTFAVNAIVPDAPTIGTATAGDTEASVAFTAPASNGGATITGYTVTSNPGGFTGTGAGSPITVTGLTNGVSYTFTVTATNSAGTGAASGASNSITPASPQTITFANPGAQSFGTSPDLGAGVSSTSGLTVAFTSSTTGVCTITGGGVLTFVATGTCTINANQAGDSQYLPAPQVTRSFTVNPASQTITFTNPGAQNFGSSPTLSATSTSGLTVTFSSSTTGVCTITSGGALTFVTAGSCTIDADQAGDATTSAAMTVSRTFTVNAIVPGAPTIGTATAGDTQAFVTFTAPASTGGAAITGYTVTANPGGATGTGAGSPITVTGLTNGVSYTFTVTATNSAGTGGASAASNSVTPASPQTITFANPGAQTYGTSPTLTATSDSGLTPTFTSSTTGVCTITSGGVLTFVTAGTCTINADQAGDSSYLPASQVSRSFTVNPAVPGAPTIGTAVAGDTQASVAFTAPVNTGGTSITGYTVTVSPPHVAPVNGASSPIVVTGLTNGQAYTFTVAADNVAGTGPSSGASNSITPAATQTITFNNPGAQNFGTTPTLTATSDSGLTPTFTSSTTGVCTITSGGALTFVTAGTCTINADQAGNGSYLAAPQVSRSFTVNAVVPGAPTIGTAAAGNTQATVTFTAPASNGGSAITGYTVIANPGAITRSATGSPYTFTGLTNGTSYTFTVTATNAVGAGSPSAASNAVTPIASQTITFNALTDQVLGSSLTATATASSGLTPVFSSATPAVCSVSAGGAVTLLTTGTCTLNADQAGNASFQAAPTVSQSFAVTPVPNSAPVITQGASVNVTMSEDASPTAFALSLAATDANSDPLTWSISGPAQHGSASVSASGVVSYAPTANYHGPDSLVVQVSDGQDSDTITVNITVTPVNDAPTISGTPATSLDQDTAYSFTPTASDPDTGDVLTFSITNKPTWASFNTATGALTGTPAGSDAGKTLGIEISVSDGTGSAALPAFDIEVIATVDPLQPIVTPPADLDVNATGLFTAITLRQLLGVDPDATQENIDAVLKELAVDGVSGNECCTTMAEGFTAENALLLPPGRHEVQWRSTNAVGVTGEAIQVVNIKPIVSLSKSQIAIRGSEVEFRVLLNGPSPQYPLTVPYVVDAATTATAAEHNLVSGSVTFTQAGQLEVTVPVSLAAVSGFGDSQLVVALGDGINAGAANRHVIDIRQGNIPPVVSLSVSQGGVNTSLVTPNGGPVSVTATVTDANKEDTHTYDWSATAGLADTDGDPTNATRVLDATGLSGSNQVQLTVTDSAGASVRASAYFRVVSSLPVLDVNTDTDRDGIGDSLEGTGDNDDNGIPDYLDNMPSPNILPQQGNTTNSYLIECDPGVRCGLGLFARSGASGGVQVLDEELGSIDNIIVDPAFEPVGGIFDFAIRDLPTPGQSVRVVIPQRAAIPANAVYRKYQNGRWVTFVVDNDNSVHSARGNPGYCPPPGTADWTPGLTAGHLCVQLTIEDGGPNDDDGLVNSAVVDPGAVSIAQALPPPPPPPKPPVQVNTKGGGSVGGFWILLLGGLLMLKRVKGKSLLLLAGLLASSSQAQSLQDIYLRMDAMSVESTQEEGDFTGALAGHEFRVEKYDTDRIGYQLALGYDWNTVTYTQLGYLDLGDVTVNMVLDGDADQGAFAADLAAEYPITATGVTLVQGVKFGLGERVRVGVEAGVYLWEGEVDANGIPFSIAEDSGTDPVAGVTLDLPMGDKFSLGIALRRVFFSEQEVNLYSIGSILRF